MLNQKKSKKYYDKDSDSMYVVVRSGVEDSYEEIAPGINIEYDKNKNAIGIEYLNFSRFLSQITKSDSKKVEYRNQWMSNIKSVDNYFVNSFSII